MLTEEYLRLTKAEITNTITDADIVYTEIGKLIDRASLPNPLVVHDGSGITMAYINNLVDNSDGYITKDLLFIQNPGAISGEFSFEDIATLKKVCFTNAEKHNLRIPTEVLDTTGIFINAGGAELNQTVIDAFFADTNNLKYNECTSYTFSNAVWNGNFCVSPSTAETNKDKFTKNNLRGKIYLGENTTITNMNLNLNNDPTVIEDTFSINSKTMHELTEILFEQIKPTDDNKANINLNLGSMATNILDTSVNSDGTGKIQLYEFNLGDTIVSVRFSGDVNHNINASVINGWIAVIEDTAIEASENGTNPNIGFYSDLMKNINVIDDGPLLINEQDKTIENVTFNCFVEGDLSNNIIKGTVSFKNGAKVNLFSTFSPFSTDRLDLEGDVTGTNISELNIGILNATNVTAGTLDGTVYDIDTFYGSLTVFTNPNNETLIG